MTFDREKCWAQGQRYLQRGQTDKAIAEFEQIVAEDPSDLRAPLKIGDLELQRGNAAGARPHFLRVADAYMAQGFWSKAGALLKQLAQADPEELQVQALLADVYERQGLAAESNQQWLRLGQMHEKAGHAAEARAALAHIGTFEACDVDLALAWAKVAKSFEPPEALQAKLAPLLQALERDGKGDAWAQLGAELLELEPQNATLACALARHHLARQRPADALVRLRTGFRGSPQDQQVMQLLAEAFEALGQIDKALAVWVELAAQTRRRGQVRSLERMLTEVLRLDPAHAEARAELGRLQVAHGGGAPMVRQGGKKGPERTGAAAVTAGEVAGLLVEARIFQRYRLLARAREVLARVLASFPDQAEARALDQRYREEQEQRRRARKASAQAAPPEAAIDHTAPNLSLSELQAAAARAPAGRAAPAANAAGSPPDGGPSAGEPDTAPAAPAPAPGRAPAKTIVARELDFGAPAPPAKAPAPASSARLISSLSSTEAGLDVDALDALIAEAAPQQAADETFPVQATLDALASPEDKEGARYVALLEMGRAYADMELWADALAQFDQVKVHGPLAAEAWLLAGQTQARHGEREAAVGSFHQGLSVPTATDGQKQRLEAALVEIHGTVDGAQAGR